MSQELLRKDTTRRQKLERFFHSSPRETLRREAVMDLHLTPETEAKLNELARRTRRGADELLEKAVDHLVTYNEWFERKVRDSQAALERGETLSHEHVRDWLEARESR